MSHFGEIADLPVRTYDQEKGFLEQLSPTRWRIKKGFVPNMNVDGVFYVNAELQATWRIVSDIHPEQGWCVPYDTITGRSSGSLRICTRLVHSMLPHVKQSTNDRNVPNNTGDCAFLSCASCRATGG